MFQSFGHGLITIAGMIVAAIIAYDMVEHGDAVTGMLKVTGNFITTETSTLEAK